VNLLDANSVISTLGLIGVLGIIFMETGLLIGLVFPGGEVVFLAGIAASGSGAAALVRQSFQLRCYLLWHPLQQLLVAKLVIGLAEHMEESSLIDQIAVSSIKKWFKRLKSGSLSMVLEKHWSLVALSHLPEH